MKDKLKDNELYIFYTKELHKQKKQLKNISPGTVKWNKKQSDIQKLSDTIDGMKVYAVSDNIANISDTAIEKLTKLRICRNHTGRWGVLVGHGSCTYKFMNEDKKEVIKYIKENFNDLFL